LLGDLWPLGTRVGTARRSREPRPAPKPQKRRKPATSQPTWSAAPTPDPDPLRLRLLLRQQQRVVRVVGVGGELAARKAQADVLLHRLHYALPGRDAAVERRGVQGERHSPTQARGW
jgi:hypothetical protein